MLSAMQRLTLETVFDALFERVKANELFVERELARVETAVHDLKHTVTRRIDALDGRMDDFRKRHGDRNEANVRTDDPSRPARENDR